VSLGEVLERIGDDVVGTQPRPEPGLAVLAVAIALLVVFLPGSWQVARHVLTIVHEGGHATAALLSGRRLSGIRLHADTSGLTVSRGRPRGPGMVLTAVAGYPAPALVGLGAAYLLSRERGLLALWLALLLLALVLLQIRNFYGLYVVLVAAVALVGVTWWGSADLQGVAAWSLTGLLLLGAPRTVVELQSERRRARGRSSDADVLAKITPLPGIVWVGLMLAANLGCLAAGTSLLLA
jgi:hypothetical protein